MVSDSSQILPVHWHLFASKDMFVPYLGSSQFFTTSPVTHYFFPSSLLCSLHNSMEVSELVILFQAATFSCAVFPCLVNSSAFSFFACGFKT